MAYLDEAYDLAPFSLVKKEKETFLFNILSKLTEKHISSCAEYKKIFDKLDFDFRKIKACKDLPFLPVSLFKLADLKSISDDEVFKTMTSSGTSGQATSKIYIDRESATYQQKTLIKIVSDFLGGSRLPMLIIDSPSVIKDRKKFSARGAGILGFSIFGSDKAYALDDDMQIDFPVVEAFLEKHKGKKILLFGFTFMVWQYFYKELLKAESKLDLSEGVLIHGGGWKKLINEAVSPLEFNKCLYNVCGVKNVHDYYGMVEQTGTIYMQCEQGHLHASIFSDVIMRRPHDFSICDLNEKGIIQVLSILPTSYPGHSLLTEDEGEILGVDDCACGRKGKYFKIHGRIKNAEVRGCSDTYEQG